MSDSNILTKNKLKSITGIKVDTDHFSYSVISHQFIPITETDDKHPKLKLFLVKTSKLKEINKKELITELDPEHIKTVEITLQSTEAEDQIFLNSNVTNLCNSFMKIISVLKQEA